VCKPQRHVVALEQPAVGSEEQVAAMERELAHLRAALAGKTMECDALRERLSSGGEMEPLSAVERLSARLTFHRRSSAAARATTLDGTDAVGATCDAGLEASARGPKTAADLLAAARRARFLAGASVPSSSSLLPRVMCVSHPKEGLGCPEADTVPLPSSPGVDREACGEGSPPLLRKCSTFGGHECGARLSASIASGDAALGASTTAGMPMLQTQRVTAGYRESTVDGSGSSGSGNGGVCAAGDDLAEHAQRGAALREYIIQQLVQLLQQRKAEARMLRAQVGSLREELAASLQDASTAKRRLLDVTEGVKKLQVAREAEFGKWSGALKDLDTSLVAAQKESQLWRTEATALQVKLAEAKASCSMRAEQLRRMSQAVLQSGQQGLMSQVDWCPGEDAEASREVQCTVVFLP
jgi:hypothetical protein